MVLLTKLEFTVFYEFYDVEVVNKGSILMFCEFYVFIEFPNTLRLELFALLPTKIGPELRSIDLFIVGYSIEIAIVEFLITGCTVEFEFIIVEMFVEMFAIVGCNVEFTVEMFAIVGCTVIV
jgi:hypothetical protein